MSEIMLCKQIDGADGLTEAEREQLKFLLFKLIDGHGHDDKKSWRQFWNSVLRMSAGELFSMRTLVPRYLPIHKRFFGMMAELYDSQEIFTDKDVFLIYLKIASGYVTWHSGKSGGVVPVPNSISFAKCDEGEFKEFREMIAYCLRSPNMQKKLWPKSPAIQSAAYIEDLLQRWKES